MVAEQRVKQVPYTVCKPVCYTQDDQLRAVRAEGRVLHGHPVRPGGRVQASAGQGILPGAVLLRADGLRPACGCGN